MPDLFVAEKSKEKPPEKTVSAPKQTENSDSAFIEFGEEENNGPIHLLSSFGLNPRDMTFQNEERDERVILFLRKHFITNFPWLVIGIFLLLLPFLIPFFGSIPGNPFTFLPANFTLVFVLFYYLLVATYLFVNFITWYFNISFVTNKRIVDVDFSGLVYKNVASTKLELVQDVSYDQVGVFRSFFNYGDVLVQTAGTIDNFDFTAVPEPEKVVHLIGSMIGENNDR
jgi:hypothetical protein